MTPHKQPCEHDGVKNPFEETNIKFLVEEMKQDAEEYDLHNEFCGTAYENECDCENMKTIKAFALEWMAKVNEKWYRMTEAHRPYCTPDGNKIITRILGKNNRLLRSRVKVR